MIIYGVNPVLEAIRSHPDRIRYIAVAKDHGGKVQRVIGAAKSAGVAVRMVPAPRSEDPPPVLALAVSVGPNASIASAARTPSTMPSTPPTTPWARDSPAI